MAQVYAAETDVSKLRYGEVTSFKSCIFAIHHTFRPPCDNVVSNKQTHISFRCIQPLFNTVRYQIRLSKLYEILWRNTF